MVCAMATQAKARVLLVDNYDSYTYNVYQMLSVVRVETGEGPIGVQVDVVENDRPIGVQDLGHYNAIVLSPGPGTPENASDVGLCRDILQLCEDVPVLGVCLGHQALAYAHGCKVRKAPVPFHGRLSRVVFPRGGDVSGLFAGIPARGGGDFDVVRYHSLVAEEDGLPDCIVPLAWTEPDEESDGRRLIMALMHKDRPHYGVQFHPESICTSYGAAIFENFVRIALGRRGQNWPDRSLPVPSGERIGRRVRGPSGARLHDRTFDEGLWVNVCAIQSEETVCTESLFLGCCCGEDTFWLDSSNLSYSGARFSYMGRRGGELWRRVEYTLGEDQAILGTMTVVGGDGQSEAHTFMAEEGTTFWDCLDDMVESTARAVAQGGVSAVDASGLALPPGFSAGRAESNELPFDFQCGLVGYIGYEMKEQCGGCRKHASGYPDASLFFADQMIAVDHEACSVYLLELCETRQDRPSRWMREAVESMAAAGSSRGEGVAAARGCGGVELQGAAWSRDHRDYVQDIESCKEYLLEGESYEICLTNRLRIPGEISRPLDYYRRLRKRNPAPYSAFLDFSGSGRDGVAVCCSSPERFLKLTQEGVLEAKPIKGTVRRGANKEADAEALRSLRGSGKDRAENLMIVDLLRNDMGRVSRIGSVHVPKLMDIETYATVHQMVSTVRGLREEGVTAVECIRCAFPAGSMTGAPKIRTMQIIDQLEHEARGVYSGAIGYISAAGGSFDLNVVIRTAVFSGGRTVIGAGGAITIQSESESEWDEIVAKSEVIRTTLEECAC